jgi:hypothetical protein
MVLRGQSSNIISRSWFKSNVFLVPAWAVVAAAFVGQECPTHTGTLDEYNGLTRITSQA